MSVGLFVGSFNPFTIGHADIVNRSLGLFTKVVIGVVGDQVNKPGLPPAEARKSAIEALYKDEPKVSVVIYNGLAVELAQSLGAHYIIKGVRSVKDFEYEREQADINRMLTHGAVETLFLPALPELSHVSSSMVRELNHFEIDTKPFLP